MNIYVRLIVTIVILLAFIVPGYALTKLKLIKPDAKGTLSNILLYVCQPALIINSFCIYDEADWETLQSCSKLSILQNFAITAAISLLAMLLVFALCKAAFAKLFIRLKDKETSDIYTYISIFSNCAFLGVPFIQIATDNNIFAVLYLMIFNLVFTLTIWTLGVYLITGSTKNISFKKVVLNPSVISTAIALLLFFVPKINFFMFDNLDVIQIFPQYLAHMTAPLSMIIVGISMATMPLKKIFTDRGAYLAGAVRLIIAPLLTFCIAIVFYLMLADTISADMQPDYIFLAPVIAMAMSPAATVVAMAEHYEKNVETATIPFILNTLISIVTVPCILVLAMSLWGMLA